MIDLRIKSEHVYYDEIAEEIYWQVGDYWKLMDEICRRVVKRLSWIFGDRWQKYKNKVVKAG